MMVVAQGKKRLLEHDIDFFASSGVTSRSLNEVDTSDMEVGALLGKGSFSAAYAVDDRFAIKMLQPKLLETPHVFAICAADLVREGMILQALQHPNVVKCHSTGELQAFANGRHDSCVLLLDGLHRTLKDQLAEWRNDIKQCRSSSTDQNGSGLVNSFFRLRVGGGVQRRRPLATVERTNILCELADALQYRTTTESCTGISSPTTWDSQRMAN